MEIKLGTIIKIICSNQVIEAGRLVEYTDHQMVLELVDGSLFIINDPFKNVVAIKLMPARKGSSNPAEVHLEHELEPDQYIPQEKLRAMRLADLHKMRADEERKRARELLRSKKIETAPEVQFGYPVFTKSLSQHPKKKA